MVEINRELLKYAEEGISVGLDSFGSGYYSILEIQKLSIKYLKIEKDIVKNIQRNGQGYLAAKSIIAMAHSLGVKTLATGVETKEQEEILTSLGCCAGQGFLYSPAIDISSFERKYAQCI